MILDMLFQLKSMLDLGKEKEGGQGLVEYALIILFVALVAIGAMRLFGIELKDTFGYINNQFPSP